MSPFLSVEVLIPAGIILGILFAILMFRRLEKKEEALRKSNSAILLNHSIKREAKVLNSRVFGEVMNGDRRSLVAGKFNIKILDSVEEYILRRTELAVPLQNVSDLKYDNVIPVHIHRDDRNLVLFEFDREGPRFSFRFATPDGAGTQ